MLEAIARDALGDADAARRTLEQALDRAGAQDLLFPFLFTPAPELLERHRWPGTAHAVMITDILNLLGDPSSGRRAALPGAGGGPWGLHRRTHGLLAR